MGSAKNVSVMRYLASELGCLDNWQVRPKKCGNHATLAKMHLRSNHLSDRSTTRRAATAVPPRSFEIHVTLGDNEGDAISETRHLLFKTNTFWEVMAEGTGLISNPFDLLSH
jgi:hypothetical protein